MKRHDTKYSRTTYNYAEFQLAFAYYVQNILFFSPSSSSALNTGPIILSLNKKWSSNERNAHKMIHFHFNGILYDSLINIPLCVQFMLLLCFVLNEHKCKSKNALRHWTTKTHITLLWPLMPFVVFLMWVLVTVSVFCTVLGFLR